MVQQYLSNSNYNILTLNPPQQTTPTNNSPKKKPFAIRDSQARLSKFGRPGSKRYQRYLNSSFLQEQQWDLHPDDFEVVRPISCSPFTQLFESHNARKWAPFVEVTEEEQEELLCRLSGALESDIEDEFGDFVFINSEVKEEEEIKVPSYPAEILFQRVDKKIRRVIQKNSSSQFLANLEEEIINYIQMASYHPITFKFQQSFHRMICHGICQFYSLKSKSEDAVDTRVVIVCKPKAGLFSPSISLTKYLATLES